MQGAKVYLEFTDRRLELEPGTSTLGRSHRCQVVLADRSASRQHALLSVGKARITLQDLGSSNGTLVNGKEIRGEVLVEDGDSLVIGETEMRLRVVPLASPAATMMMPAPVPPPAAAGSPPPPPQRSEAVAVGDVLPVGEVLATPSASWESTGVLQAAREKVPSAVPPAPVAETIAMPPQGPPLPPIAPPPAPTAAAPAPPPSVPAEEAGVGEDPSQVLSSLEDLDRQLGALPSPPSSPRPAAAPRAGRPQRSAPRRPTTPLPVVDLLPAAGFWVRAAALLLDSVWMALAAAVAVLAARRAGAEAAADLAGSAVALALAVLVPVIGWSRWGTTPGKALLGLYVCDLEGRVGLSPGRAVLRWLAYLVSALPLGLGFLLVGLSAHRRGFHDLIAGTYVGQRPRR